MIVDGKITWVWHQRYGKKPVLRHRVAFSALKRSLISMRVGGQCCSVGYNFITFLFLITLGYCFMISYRAFSALVVIYRSVHYTRSLSASAKGGTGTHLKVGGHNFLSCPSTFWLYKYNLSFWWALLWWSLHFGQFLVCCSSTHGAPCAQPFIKVGARAPVPHGVGATECILYYRAGY